MKKLVILLAFFAIVLAGSQDLKAQYNTGIGARLGPYLGLTIKHNFDQNSALEAIVEARYRGMFITGLYEYHIPLEAVDGLRLYVGGGAHIGYWSRAVGNTIYGSVERGAFVGIDGILGLEYTFDSAPINISLDYKPAYNFAYRNYGWGYDNGALSIRYVF